MVATYAKVPTEDLIIGCIYYDVNPNILKGATALEYWGREDKDTYYFKWVGGPAHYMENNNGLIPFGEEHSFYKEVI